ncbi:MAG: hypothetical protein Q9165_001600 [Trypethelium subeluteriae]
MSAPVTIDELIERNKYDYDHVPLPLFSEFEHFEQHPPTVAVETVVLRTAGGRVKPIFRDLLYLDGLLSLKNIMVIHHTDCGKSFMTDGEARSALKKRLPDMEEIDSLEFGSFKDSTLEQSVKDDVLFLREAPLLRRELGEASIGFTYDVKTDDESDDSTPPSSPPAPIVRRSKFDDEEDSDEVLDSWDAAEDSEVEREKATKAAEAKAKAEAEAKAAHKTKTQRINDNIQRRKEEAAQEDSSDEDEDEAERRERLRRSEKDSDLKHAEDLFGDIDLNRKRAAPKPAAVVAKTAGAGTTTSSAQNDLPGTVDLASLPLFKPATKDQFGQLRDALVPLLTANAKKPQYSLFLVDFAKALAKELPSDQIKKVASGLTTLSNEKMKEEKAAEKGGKKTKAAKTKASLVATRDVSTKADTIAYDDGLEE